MNVWEDPRVQRGMESQLKRRRELIAAGVKPVGWKIGFGAQAIMRRLNISGRLVGFLMQQGYVASGGTVSLAGWASPIAEPEVAVYMGKDLAAGADRATAMAAIATIAPALEPYPWTSESSRRFCRPSSRERGRPSPGVRPEFVSSPSRSDSARPASRHARRMASAAKSAVERP